MAQMKTPGVYVVEKSAFPNSVVEAATAVPAFIGYTRTAKNGTKSLLNVPWRISSMAEFVQYYGSAPVPEFSFTATPDASSFLSLSNGQISQMVAGALKTAANSVDAALIKATASANAAEALEDAEDDAKEALQATADKTLAAFKASAAKVKEDVTAATGLVANVNTVFAETYPVTKVEDLTTAVDEAIEDAGKYVDSSVANALKEASEEFNGADLSAFKTVYYGITQKTNYNLYNSMRFFFANGGGVCYVVSVNEGYTDDLDKDRIIAGIAALKKEEEPTLVVVPEAVQLGQQACYDIQLAMLAHCGFDMKNRFAILDVYNGYKDRQDEDGDPVKEFREAIGTNFLDYGAAYYPWVNTSVVSESEVNFTNITEGTGELALLLKAMSASRTLDGVIDRITDVKYGASGLDGETINMRDTTQKILSTQMPLYAGVMKEMLHQLNLMAPSAAMAGTYTLIDSTKEVWKAPANVSLNNVISTTVNISSNEQEDLNVPMDGKGVNAIRYFNGEGIKVWGARTLDGNSLDWRYINVRRTMLMLEESIKNAAKAFVFEPNVANTWVSVRSMIGNFLNGIWKRGGLAGSTPEEAFSVHIGLGETMTPEDILEGKMLITVLVAISRPAEFIEITFQQQMQKS